MSPPLFKRRGLYEVVVRRRRLAENRSVSSNLPIIVDLPACIIAGKKKQARVAGNGDAGDDTRWTRAILAGELDRSSMGLGSLELSLIDDLVQHTLFGPSIRLHVHNQIGGPDKLHMLTFFVGLGRWVFTINDTCVLCQ